MIHAKILSDSGQVFLFPDTCLKLENLKNPINAALWSFGTLYD